MTRRVSVEIIGDSKSLERAFTRASASGRGFSSSLGKVSVGLGTLVKSAVVFNVVDRAIEGLTSSVHEGIHEFSEHAQVAAQTAAALKSTGGIANVTGKQIEDLGLRLSNLSGVDDEVIQKGENLLLSFTKIRNFAGKNNDIFTQATQVMLDFSVRTGRDAASSAIILGRALEDPARRVASLSRAGVVFTKSQIDQLKVIQKTKGVFAAQKVLLKELEIRFQGAAAAAGKTLPGQLAVLHDRFKDLAGELVGVFAPAVTKGVSALTGFVRELSEANGFHAKLGVVFDTSRDIGRKFIAEVKSQISAVDWGTIPARLDVLFTDIGKATRNAQAALKKAIDDVDWEQVFAAAGGIADGLQARIEQIDWSKVGKAIGDGIAKGVAAATSVAKVLADRFELAFRSIDFNKLGRAAGPGLAVAMLSALAAITDPVFWVKNWDLILAIAASFFGKGLIKIGGRFAAPFAKLGARMIGDLALAIAAQVERFSPRLAELLLKAGLAAAAGLSRGLALIGGFVDGALGALRRKLGKGLTFVVKVLGIQAAIDSAVAAFQELAKLIGHALDGAFALLRETSVKVVLDIVEPFSHLPGALGGWARKMKKSLQLEYDAMRKDARDTGAAIAAALTPAPQSAAKPIGSRNSAAAFGGDSTDTIIPSAPGGPGRKINFARRNSFFDSAISRDLNRVQDIRTISGQIARLQQIAGLIEKRLAATKDVTRRLNLEDKLLDVFRQIKSDRKQLAADFFDALQLGLEEAQASGGFGDDLRELGRIQTELKARIKAEGATVELQRQLFQNRQQIADTRRQQRDAKQFFQLGLGPTGDVRVPLASTLRRQLGTVTDSVKGTFLDTKKTETLLSNIRKVLSSVVPPSSEVRSKVREMFATLNDELKKGGGGDLTKFQHVSTSKLLAGLGLSPDQVRALRPRLVQIGVNGTVHSGQTAAFSGGGGGGTTFVLHNPQFHGVNDIRTLKKQLEQEAARRTTPRRGR